MFEGNPDEVYDSWRSFARRVEWWASEVGSVHRSKDSLADGLLADFVGPHAKKFAGCYFEESVRLSQLVGELLTEAESWERASNGGSASVRGSSVRAWEGYQGLGSQAGDGMHIVPDAVDAFVASSNRFRSEVGSVMESLAYHRGQVLRPPGLVYASRQTWLAYDSAAADTVALLERVVSEVRSADRLTTVPGILDSFGGSDSLVSGQEQANKLAELVRGLADGTMVEDAANRLVGMVEGSADPPPSDEILKAGVILLSVLAGPSSLKPDPKQGSTDSDGGIWSTLGAGGTSLLEAGDRATGWLADSAEGAVDYTADSIARADRWASNSIDGATEWASSGFRSAGGWLQEGVDGVGGWANSGADGFTAWATEIFDESYVGWDLPNTITTTGYWLGDGTNRMIDWVDGGVTGAGGWVLDGAEGAGGWALDGATGTVDWALASAIGFNDWATGTVVSATEWGLDSARKASAELKQAAEVIEAGLRQAAAAIGDASGVFLDASLELLEALMELGIDAMWAAESLLPLLADAYWTAVLLLPPVGPIHLLWPLARIPKDMVVEVFNQSWNRHVTPAVVDKIYLLIDDGLPSTNGTPGIDEPRSTGRFHLEQESALERGRAAVIQALTDTADSEKIRDDEFQIVKHDNGNYTVVLGGVTDLSNPGHGLNPNHFTARDTDWAASYSGAATGVDDNYYARLVRDYMFANIPTGSSVAIVGHSYGADTALDLASSTAVEQNFNITHVVAAAYASQPQLPSVKAGVKVLVLQNNKDIPVYVESLSHFDTRSEREGKIEADVVFRRFNGGLSGYGHHQDHYNKYLLDPNDRKVEEFLMSWSDEGYGNDGETISYDVTVPVEDRAGNGANPGGMRGD